MTYRIFAVMMFSACSSAYEVPQDVGDGGAREPCSAMRAQAESHGFDLGDCRERVSCGECDGCAYYLGSAGVWQPALEEQCFE